jgi:hypothetical protein
MLPPILINARMTEEGDVIKSPGPPQTYLGVARSLTSAIQILAKDETTSAIAFCLLAAHQAECLLKAYLSRGGSDARLRKPDLRHNLVALWEVAVSEGLPIEAPTPRWVQRLSELHDAPYMLRYSTGVHGVVTPARSLVDQGLRLLQQEVERHV